MHSSSWHDTGGVHDAVVVFTGARAADAVGVHTPPLALGAVMLSQPYVGRHWPTSVLLGLPQFTSLA